jgi:hypothetical protein
MRAMRAMREMREMREMMFILISLHPVCLASVPPLLSF